MRGRGSWGGKTGVHDESVESLEAGEVGCERGGRWGTGGGMVFVGSASEVGGGGVGKGACWSLVKGGEGGRGGGLDSVEI